MTTDVTDDTSKPSRRTTAEAMASRQRDISVSEFFTKNRHLLGFDNPQKALLTAVKEAVDNSLDACEEAGILPSLRVQVEEIGEGRFRVTVEDNGPGIVKAQMAKIFAKLLYGSKFHRLKQSRGQQGIGISAAGMYGQLTTGRPVVITSKTGKGRPAYRLEVRINAQTNSPDILKDEIVPLEKDHGTEVVIEMSGLYRAGRASVQSYLEQTIVANPHLELTFQPPKGEAVHFPRASEQLPPETQEIKPHPYGVELGMLIKAFQESGDRTAREVLTEDFSRVTSQVANELLRKAHIESNAKAARLDGPKIEDIHRVIQVSQATLPPIPKLFKLLQKREDKFTTAIQELGSNFTPGLVEELFKRAGIETGALSKRVESTQLDKFQHALEAMQVRILPPPATCVAPVGEALIVEGLKRRFKAEFFASHTRPPAVYRGNPFVVEVGIAFGGELPKDESAEILRFANRVPLLYQPRACATTEAVVKVNWKSYAREGGLNQRGSELPVGPLAVFVHLASVWVPFTNEAKEAIASYDEIVNEIRLALMECGRKLGTWVNAKSAENWQKERKSLFEKYIEEISASIGTITGVPAEKVRHAFTEALPRHVKLAPPTSAPPDGSAPAEAPSTPPSDAPPPVAAKASSASELPPDGDGDGEGFGAKKPAKKSARKAESEPPPAGVKASAKKAKAESEPPPAGVRASAKKAKAESEPPPATTKPARAALPPPAGRGGKVPPIGSPRAPSIVQKAAQKAFTPPATQSRAAPAPARSKKPSTPAPRAASRPAAGRTAKTPPPAHKKKSRR